MASSVRSGGRHGDDLTLSVKAQDFVDLLGQASKVDSKLRARLRKNLRSEAEVAATEVRAEVMGAPAKTNVGVRAGIAAGVRVQVSTKGRRVGVSIVGTSSALDPKHRAMTRLMNREQFRHPVFGRYSTVAAGAGSVLGGAGGHRRALRKAGASDRKGWTWVRQQGHPYFDKVILHHVPRVEAAVERALDEAARDAGVIRR